MYCIIQKTNSKERGSSDTESEESNHRHTQQKTNGANRSQWLTCPWVVEKEKEGGEQKEGTFKIKRETGENPNINL